MRTADCNSQVRKKEQRLARGVWFIPHAPGAQHLLCCVVLKSVAASVWNSQTIQRTARTIQCGQMDELNFRPKKERAATEVTAL
jgi:hypothetical protein